MTTFAVIAHRITPTNTRLGAVLTPAQALAKLRHGDVALGRLDILPTLDGIEPGLSALDRLDALGVTVLNGHRTLVAAHDKLATANAMFAAGVPHPRTVHVAPWLDLPELVAPLVAEASLRLVGRGRDPLRHGGRDRRRPPARADAPVVCNDRRRRAEARLAARLRPADRRRRGQRRRRRQARRCGRRVADERRARRTARTDTPDREQACAIAVAAAEAIGGDLVGVDLLPADAGTWVVLEVNGAVDFNSTYTLDEDAHHAARVALTARGAVSTCRTRGLTSGRAVPPARTGAATGTARTSGCRVPRAARP